MDYIPELCDDVFIARIENDVYYFVHQQSNDLRLKINAQTHHLLKLIDGKRTLSELTHLLTDHFKREISTQEVDQIIKNKLQPYGILKSDVEILKKNRAPYLSLRITLVPDPVVSAVTRYMQFLIFDKIWYVISILLAGLAVVYTFTISIQNIADYITPENILLYIPLSLFSRVIHELGHASACEKFRMKAGNIGFGFYLLMPVFYADVSNAWSLAPGKRIIINIAGMYFQLLLSCFLVFIYMATSNEWMLYASLINIISFLPNLNPFVRYDGYWILTDLLGTNNIMHKSSDAYKATMAWARNKIKGECPLKTGADKFLFLYFFFNKIMIGVLLFFVVLNTGAVIYFPYALVDFILAHLNRQTIFSFSEVIHFLTDNFISILFYVFLFRLLKKQYKSRFRKARSPEVGK